jgi:hypothetical protein
LFWLPLFSYTDHVPIPFQLPRSIKFL